MNEIPECSYRSKRGCSVGGGGKCFCYHPKMGAGGIMSCETDCLMCLVRLDGSEQTPKPTPQSPGCGGCEQRRDAMNRVVPGSGTLLEKFTKATGIKAAWEKLQGRKPCCGGDVNAEAAAPR